MTHPDALDEVIARCTSGAISPAIALMQLLVTSADVDVVIHAVEGARLRAGSSGNLAVAKRARIDDMLSLLQHLRSGCMRIAAMLKAGMDPAAPVPTIDEGIERCRQLFDRFVSESEEASVALYSLGSAELLARASREVVAVLQRWRLVERHRTILQIGCGIGRMEQLLAPTVRDAYGIDISPKMIATARRRCEAIPNAHFLECSGRDLALFEDGSFDLVYAVDSFPYLCQAGMPLVEMHFREIHRVLRSRGDLAIFNFSYRGDPAGDRRDVARLASEFGYDVIIDGDTPFALWDGLAFHLRRSI